MFLICGEAIFDFFLTEEDGATRLRFEAVAGGSPFNVAIGVRRQGGAAGLLTVLSDDMLGERLLRILDAENVDTTRIVRSGRRTTLSLVDFSSNVAPEYAFYGLGSADCSLTVEQLPMLGPDVTGLHFGSYSIAVSPVADAFSELARRERDRFITLDPNVRPTVVKDPDVWRARIEALLPHVDLVKVSAEDLDYIADGVDRAEVAEEWLRRSVRLVVITDGPRAATAYRAGGAVSITPPACAMVDSVGAGDAFQASLIAQLTSDGDPHRVLEALTDDALAQLLNRAASVAAKTCERRGADIPHA